MKRLTAIVASLALAILAVSVCCMSAPLAMEQHGCCKGRCASMSAAVPLPVLMPTIAANPVPVVQPVVAAVRVHPRPVAKARLFAPILTVQLRI